MSTNHTSGKEPQKKSRRRELMNKLDAKTITLPELYELRDITRQSLTDCSIIITSRAAVIAKDTTTQKATQ